MRLILSPLHQAIHRAQRVSNYFQYTDELDFTGIRIPMQMKDFVKFKTQNGISVYVFGYEKGTVYPIYLTKQLFESHVDLVVRSNGQRITFLLYKKLS